MPQGIDVQVPSLTSPGTEQLEADDVMALARESNDLLPDRRPSINERPKAAVLRGIEMLRQLLRNDCALLSSWQ